MSDVPMPQGLSQEAVAEWLHDDYERSARAVGWKTQEACRVPFADLPVANQQVMLMTARAVLALVAQERSRAIADATAQVEAKVREGVRETIRVLDEIDLCDEDRAARAADRSQP